MEHKGSAILETQRLILRPFMESDAEDMYRNWASNPKVTRYLTWPTHDNVEGTKSLLKIWEKDSERLDSYQWCIEYKENHQAIGSIGAPEINEVIEAIEIGYCIGEEYWHKGITTEALTCVRDYLFDHVKCNRIWAGHDVQNPNSGGVMKKAGLVYEGTLRQGGKNNTGLCDVAIYAMTRDMR